MVCRNAFARGVFDMFRVPLPAEVQAGRAVELSVEKVEEGYVLAGSEVGVVVRRDGVVARAEAAVRGDGAGAGAGQHIFLIL